MHLIMFKKLRIYMICRVQALLFQFFTNHAFRSQEMLLKAILKVRGYNNFSNMFDSGESFFICEILAPTNPKLCIDIGANKGDYSYEILNKTDASIIAFEPLNQEFIFLTERLKHYGDRFKGINMGVGSKSGRDLIYWNPRKTSHASYISKINKIDYVDNFYVQEVNTVTLDEFIQANNIHHIDLVKIDVEGFEQEVLNGALNAIKKCKVNFIQIEMNWHQLLGGNSLFYFSELLPDYKVFQLLKNSWVERDPLDPFSNLYLFSNFIFVSKQFFKSQNS